MSDTGAPSSTLPWLLLSLVVAGVASAGWFYLWPMKQALDAAVAQATALGVEADAQKARLTEAEQTIKTLENRANELQDDVQKKDQAIKELAGTKNELEAKLKDEIAEGDVLVKQYKGEIVVDLVDQILFPSGESELNDKGKDVLRRVGETLVKVPNKVIQIGGHTDKQPISGKLQTKYATNWELSVARALNVVHFLQDDVKVPGERLTAAGFSEFRPMAKNTTKEGRKKNRRIEVILLPVR